jgi:hypothetical protein
MTLDARGFGFEPWIVTEARCCAGDAAKAVSCRTGRRSAVPIAVPAVAAEQVLNIWQARTTRARADLRETT